MEEGILKSGRSYVFYKNDKAIFHIDYNPDNKQFRCYFNEGLSKVTTSFFLIKEEQKRLCWEQKCDNYAVRKLTKSPLFIR